MKRLISNLSAGIVLIAVSMAVPLFFPGWFVQGTIIFLLLAVILILAAHFENGEGGA